jgi:hypothetical protein
MSLMCSAWNNGKHHESGAGYGLKLSMEGRDRHFKKAWRTVKFLLPVEGGFKTVELNIDKPSFWNTACREVTSKEIGEWLLASGLAPWPKGSPPKFEIVPAGDRTFRLVKTQN